MVVLGGGAVSYERGASVPLALTPEPNRARRVEKVRNARTGEEESNDHSQGIQDGREEVRVYGIGLGVK